MALIKYTGVNIMEFFQAFTTDEDCYEYIASIKWIDGYKCKKCGCQNWCKGRKPYSKRCVKCKYDESPTSGTMFDKCKFPLLTAFHIAFKISTKKKGMSTLELHREFGLRQKTCWNFKWKLQQAMASSGKYLLEGEVHIDDFYIGGPEENQKGRGHEKKRLVVVAIEKVDKGVGRAYAQVIESASSKEFKPFFVKYISKNAHIVTDVWNGYLPLKKDYKNFQQIPSNKGRNLPDIHIHIMNLKGWLRGIHHHCSKEHLQGYLDEYHYRYNRRNNLDTMFHKLLERIRKNDPIRLIS